MWLKQQKFNLIFIILIFIIGCSNNDFEEQKDNLENEMEKMTLTITSPVFNNNGKIPSKYTCSGDDINPRLDIQNIPEDAKSLVLIVDDPDAPVGTWDHWIVWNIPKIETIKEDSIPGIEGVNSWGENKYGGPCPPPGNSHRYFFKIYALDTKLEITITSNKKELENAMQDHIIEQGELIGMFNR